jgi:uncharacterized protein
MTLSLREQLLKAGLVTDQQVQRFEREQKSKQYVEPRGRKKPTGPNPQQLAIQRAAAEKAAKDVELNRRKQEKLERRAKFATIKELVAGHLVPRVETEDFYNFLDGANIKRIEVTPVLRQQLVGGSLAIVRCEGRYAFVPAAIGRQIGELVPRALVHINVEPTPAAADDPYKDFVVPDDLVW